MKLTDFDYNLPDERIAKFPPEKRGDTRLMVIDRQNGNIFHKKYSDIPMYMNYGDAVVLNNTKVDRVRIFLRNPRNEKTIECILLNKIFLGEKDGFEYREAILGRAKNVNDGDILLSNSNLEVQVVKRVTETIFLIKAKEGVIDTIIANEGHIPLPPYLNREDTEEDRERYNTVFAKEIGSSAAPTASLNITDDMLEKFKKEGVEKVEVNLEVGWGTFAPIRTEDIEEHNIHEENIYISEDSAEKINNVKSNGGSVWSFGTTATRTLESCVNENKVVPYAGSTKIYIYPGYQWKVVDHLITNFHAPKSSLIVMISAFMGHELTMKAYDLALKENYNFLSYGDSMLII